MFDKFFKSPGETKNITPKILAVILAIVLWLYVINEQNPPIESSFTIPLEVRNAATSYVIVNVPDSVRVKIRGPRSIVAGVLNKDLKAYIDIKGLTEGNHDLKVSAAIPSSLELVEINPDKVQFRLDTTVSRQVPVEVRLTGAAAKGSVVGNPVAAYEQVTIEGPKNIVGIVEKVIATVDLAGKNAEFTVGAPLVPVTQAGKGVEGLTIYPEKTGVTVNITAGLTKKILDVKPMIEGELPAGLAIKSMSTKPDKLELRELTAGTGLDKLEAVYTEPISLNDISQNITREVKLILPEGLASTQETVSVTIQVGPR